MRASASSARSCTLLITDIDTVLYNIVSVVLITSDKSRREMSAIESLVM